MDLMMRRRELLKDQSDAGLLYKLSAPATFGGAVSDFIDTGTVVLPFDRDMTTLLDFTPAAMTERGFCFYSGYYTSPWHWFGIEYRSASLGWAFGGYSTYFALPNVAAGKRCRLAIRRSAGSNANKIECWDGSDMIEGIHSVRSVSPNTLVLGGYGPSSLIYKGRIDIFRAYSRRLSDREITSFLAKLPT